MTQQPDSVIEFAGTASSRPDWLARSALGMTWWTSDPARVVRIDGEAEAKRVAANHATLSVRIVDVPAIRP